MRIRARALLVIVPLLFGARSVHGEVLVRWTHATVPPAAVLGIPSLALPASSDEAILGALTHGYRVFIEGDAAALARFRLPASGLGGVIVKGNATRAQLAALRQRLRPLNARLLTLDERGKWPHIRSNWVTKNNEVLQVAGRSAQPWIENNAALIRSGGSTKEGTRLLTYTWNPITVSDLDEGPALADYLVAVAEAGSFGADLLLPLHERFQRGVLLGQPEARRDWRELRRYIEFYSANLPRNYEPMATVGVVTDAPGVWFEAMNLLARHNVAFELIAPGQLAARARPPLKTLIVLDEPNAAQADVLSAFERQGGVVKPVQEVADPNRFALELRRQLGRDERIIDIWNGITVLAAPFKEPDGNGMLVTVLNYAHLPLPVQLRIAGTFLQVHYESPEEPATLLAHEHRNGHTEFVIPALHVGGRVFLSGTP